MTEILSAPSRAPEKASSKRSAILAAAKRSFVRDGVAAASIDAIAAEAGVSRQTVYNQMGDKDALLHAVIEDVTARSSASLMRVLASFPDRPDDLQAALTEFGIRLLGRCMCDIDGQALIMLLQKEAHRFPELFAVWTEYGPGKDWPLIAGCFERLARAGYLELDDASLAARHFVALINADLPRSESPCAMPSEEALRRAASLGVTTFLRAFGKRSPA